MWLAHFFSAISNAATSATFDMLLLYNNLKIWDNQIDQKILQNPNQYILYIYIFCASTGVVWNILGIASVHIPCVEKCNGLSFDIFI